jgi:DNA-binding response OmpR family regulator
MMPDMSGQEVLEKAKDNYEDIQFVMVTAKDPEIEIADLDIDDYLIKPVEKEELKNKLKELLGRRNGIQELEALRSRRDILKNKFSEEELEKTDDYKNLLKRIEKKS